MPPRAPEYTLLREHALTAAGERWAEVSHSNPLPSGFPALARVIAWSGWYGDAADPASGVFSRDFRVWTPAAWAHLRERLDAWSAAAAPGQALILRPHARHLLSDAQACALLLREVTDERIQILLDPVGMLEPAMLRDAEDHIARILQLAPSPRIAGAVVTGADLLEDRVRPSEAGTALPRRTLENCVNRFAPALARFFPG